MDTQPEISNPPPPSQPTPPKENLLSLIKTLRYWLAALVPLLAIGAYQLLLPDLWLTLEVINVFVGWAAAFAINLLLPFATNAPRAFYALLPAFLLSVALTLQPILNWGWDNPGHWMLEAPFVCGDFLLMIPGLMFFGWLGAKLGIAIRRKA